LFARQNARLPQKLSRYTKVRFISCVSAGLSPPRGRGLPCGSVTMTCGCRCRCPAAAAPPPRAPAHFLPLIIFGRVSAGRAPVSGPRGPASTIPG
jgi:hypothetical protein